MMDKFIPWAKPTLFGNERQYMLNALDSTWISGGEYVDRLEISVAGHFGAGFGVAVSNGTTALHLALLALGIGPGDEVIVPGFTFVAPVNMAISVGATLVYADIDEKTWCMDTGSLKECITAKTKAVIPVHLYGNICEMDEIMELARSKGLYVIEDTAESAFSSYRGRYAGTFGDAGCLSFHAAKTMTTGEGGMVLTSDEELCNRMRTIRDHGMRKGKRYWHDVVGYNFRLTNLQAAMGCAQMEKLDTIIKERKRVYETYCKELSSVSGIKMQHFTGHIEPVVWTIAIKLDPTCFKGDRDFVIERLLEVGVETRPGFYALSLMPPYDAPELPVSLDVSKNVICLPTYPSLSDDEIKYICGELKKLLK